MRINGKRPECLDLDAWRLFSPSEVVAHYDDMIKMHEAAENQQKMRFGSALIFRQQLAPVDMFCYLKARFGGPNGLQTKARKDDSGNWVHWDYHFHSHKAHVYILGTDREVHFMISETLADADWPALTHAIKSDYKRFGKAKSQIKNSLEKWFVFPNHFVETANICADLHYKIVNSLVKAKPYDLSRPLTDQGLTGGNNDFQRMSRLVHSLASNCLQLTLITPVLAEAFINMMIVILCKKEIRDNERQFEAFIRSQIDAKIFDLPFKCQEFSTSVDQTCDTYKRFKRVMDKRNHTIHGNVSPEREQIEVVYFEGRRPLFVEAGDNIGKYLESIRRRCEPATVIADYEDVYLFLVYLASLVKPVARAGLWRVMEDPLPGYDAKRKITGALFPGVVVSGAAEGIKYDDELSVNWAEPRGK